MAAFIRKNEQDLREQIDELKSITIELQSAIIDLLKRSISRDPQPEETITSVVDKDDQYDEQGNIFQKLNRDECSTKSKTMHSRSNLVFDGIELSIVDHQGCAWLTASDLSRALGYKQSNQITHIYRRNKNEFTSKMTDKVKLTLSGNLQCETRIFSPRGCHLIAMFARTERAAAFRRWVLDVLESLDDIQHHRDVPKTTTVKTTGEFSSAFHDCGIHDSEFLAFLAVTKGRMGGRRTMNELVSIHTAKVLRWLWYHCSCESQWYEASRKKIGQDLGMHHTTALRCARRLERWGFIKQRNPAGVTECQLLRSVVKLALNKAGAFQGPATSIDRNTGRALPAADGSSPFELSRLANVAGSAVATLFLAKAIECQHQTGETNGGWWRKTRNQWTAETGLSRCEQESARRLLRHAGILTESRRGLPAQMWYRIDETVLTRLMNQPSVIRITAQPRWH